MNLSSALILSSLTAGLADSHTPHLRVYCVPEACAPALAATFPDAFAPHPGPKTRGHPAWPEVTPAMTPARPHHTATHKNKIYGRNHNPKQTPFAYSHKQSRTRKPPVAWPQTHRCKDISTTSNTGKEEEKGKTEMVGLPQQHYSNATQRLPTKERERQRKKQMRSKEKRKQSRPFMYSILIWHATWAHVAVWGCELTETQTAKC